jgi:hypothetical protein
MFDPFAAIRAARTHGMETLNFIVRLQNPGCLGFIYQFGAFDSCMDFLSADEFFRLVFFIGWRLNIEYLMMGEERLSGIWKDPLWKIGHSESGPA